MLLHCCIFTNIAYILFADAPNLENNLVISKTSTKGVEHTTDKISDCFHSLSSNKLDELVQNTDEFMKSNPWLTKGIVKTFRGYKKRIQTNS